MTGPARATLAALDRAAATGAGTRPILVVGPSAMAQLHWGPTAPAFADFLACLPDDGPILVAGPTLPALMGLHVDRIVARADLVRLGMGCNSAETEAIEAYVAQACARLSPRAVTAFGCGAAELAALDAARAAGVPVLARLDAPALATLADPTGDETVSLRIAARDRLRRLAKSAFGLLVTSPAESRLVVAAVPEAAPACRLFLGGHALPRPIAAERPVAPIAVVAGLEGAVSAERRFLMTAARIARETLELTLRLLPLGEALVDRRASVASVPLDVNRNSSTAAIGLYVVPPRAFGFARNMTEALSMGWPCLVPATTFGRDVDEDDGFVAYPDSPAGLADLIGGLLADRDRLARIGQAAARFAAINFRRSLRQAIVRSLFLDHGLSEGAPA